MPISVDQLAQRKALISLQPAYNPTSSVDLANLNTFLASCLNSGVVADVILWPNPFSAGLTSAQYQAMIAYYGPTVRSYFPLVYHSLAGLGTGGSAATFTSFYPGDANCDKVMVTFTASGYEGGVTLDAYAAVADSATPAKPFGIAEMEANDSTDTAANIAAFFTYTQTFMANRLTAGKNNGDVLWYNETATLTSLWSTIDTGGDPMAAQYATLFDTLTGGGVTPPSVVSFTASLPVAVALAPALAGGTGGGQPPPVPPPPSQPPSPHPEFPFLILEAGFSPADPAPTVGALLLGDPTNGIIGIGTLYAGTIWTDLSPFVRSGDITRGSSRQQAPVYTYQVGTASAVLKDPDARFDPDNLAGPYVDSDGDGRTLIAPMLPVRYRAIYGGTEYRLFSGYVDAWVTPDTNWGPRYAETQLTASDGFKVLANIQRPGGPDVQGANEDSGARINRILDSVAWSPTDRLISPGDTNVQGTTLAGDPLSEMQLVADTELGELYINAECKVVFRHRNAISSDPQSTQVQAVFGDSPGSPVTSLLAVTGGTGGVQDLYALTYGDAYGSGTVSSNPGSYADTYTDPYPGPAGTFTGFFELPYTAVGRGNDDTQLCNDVQITRVGGTLQETTDAASVAQFLYLRSYTRDDLLLLTDQEALDYSAYLVLLAKDGERRFDTLTINPMRDPTNLLPQVLGREIGDRIQVWRRPPGMGGQPIVKDVFIRSIAHTFDVSSWSWETVWELQDAGPFEFMVAGDPKRGVIGSNQVGY